jgi:hypothetical protein
LSLTHASFQASGNVNELLNKDADDESLQKYKASLGLGGATEGERECVPRSFLVSFFKFILSTPDVAWYFLRPSFPFATHGLLLPILIYASQGDDGELLHPKAPYQRGSFRSRPSSRGRVGKVEGSARLPFRLFIQYVFPLPHGNGAVRHLCIIALS